MQFHQLSNTVPIEFGKQFISFITGDHNADRISLKYFHDQETGILYAEVNFGRLAQGPPGHTHGGAISAVFDELMGACCWVNGHPSMTAQYTTRFFKPAPLNIPLLFSANIKVMDGNKINLEAQLTDADNQKFAEARGLFISQDMETFKKMSQMNSNASEQLREMKKH